MSHNKLCNGMYFVSCFNLYQPFVSNFLFRYYTAGPEGLPPGPKQQKCDRQTNVVSRSTLYLSLTTCMQKALQSCAEGVRSSCELLIWFPDHWRPSSKQGEEEQQESRGRSKRTNIMAGGALLYCWGLLGHCLICQFSRTSIKAVR